MIKNKSIVLFTIAFCFSMCAIQANTIFAQEGGITVKELIAKHIASLGNSEALSKVKSRGVSGGAGVIFIQGASGSLKDGSFLCVSDGQNIGMQMKFNDTNYPGEHIAYNGKQITVKDITPGRKSPLADFIFTYNALVKEGYWGGTLSTAWPLLHYGGGEGQPEYQLKRETLKNRDFYVLERAIAQQIDVKLFFDVSTYRHMRTEYRVRHKENIAANASVVSNSGTSVATTDSTTVAAREARATIQETQPDSIYKLVELFDQPGAIGGKEKGVILPMVYGIEYSQEGHGQSFLAQWTMILSHFANNGNVDQAFFNASK